MPEIELKENCEACARPLELGLTMACEECCSIVCNECCSQSLPGACLRCAVGLWSARRRSGRAALPRRQIRSLPN